MELPDRVIPSGAEFGREEISSLRSQVDEIHRLVIAKQSWQGKDISKSAPILSSVLDGLVARAGDFPQLTSEDAHTLYEDLSEISEQVHSSSQNVALAATCNKIELIIKRLEELQLGPELPPEKAKEEPIPIKKYDSLELFSRDLEAIVAALRGKTVSETKLTSLKDFIQTNSPLIGRDKEQLAFLIKLKAVNPYLFIKILGSHVSDKNCNVKEMVDLGLTEQELLDLAPYITELTLSDLKKDDQGNLKNCSFTERTIANLLKNSPNVTKLHIENCNIIDTVFSQLIKPEKLRELSIEHCRTSNQALPATMSQLQKFVIKYCPNFNQPFPETMRLLEELEIWACENFNQAIPASVKKLRIITCDNFNQAIPAMLNELIIVSCNNFKQRFSATMNELRELIIRDCHNFNQALPVTMNELRKLSIVNCESFNQKLPAMMKELRELNISFCRKFNQGFSATMNRLQKLTIFECPKFDLFSHPIQTSVAYARFCPEDFRQHWSQLHAQEKEAIVRSLLNDRNEMLKIETSPAEYLVVLDAFEIETSRLSEQYPRIAMLSPIFTTQRLVKKGEDDALIWASYSSLKAKGNFLNYLSDMVHFFPDVTGYMIEKHREEISGDIEGLSLDMKNLSVNNRLALLPLLSAETIQETIHEVPSEERLAWMEQPIQFEQFSGSIRAVLKQLKEANLDRATSQEQENILPTIREMLKIVPLKALASMACDEEGVRILLPYLVAFAETQLACVVPLLPKETLVEYLKKQPDMGHLHYLRYAANEQKEYYLKSDLLASKIRYEWDTSTLPALDSQIKEFTQEPTQEKFAKLKEQLGVVGMRSGLILQQYSLLLKGFKEKLLLMSSPANITQLIEELVSKKQEQLQAMKEEWKFRENLIMKELSQKVPALVEIPNEFIDIITGTPMTDPYMDEHGHTCDKATWEQTIKETGKNPFNRAPMTLSEIFPNEEMKKKILDFQQKNPDVWKRGI